MQRPTVLTILILAAAILSFAGLAYQTVPVRTTLTSTQIMPMQYIERLESYSPHTATKTATYTTTYSSSWFFTTAGTSSIAMTATTTSTTSMAFITPLEVMQTYGNWIIAAIIVIVIVVLSMWLVFQPFLISRLAKQPKITEAKTVESKTEEATTTTSKNRCIECGAKLAPASRFCYHCGAKQP